LKQFQVGEKAVYPVHGVAEVIALEKRDIGGAQTSVYILKILETPVMKLIVPTANAATVGLRELIPVQGGQGGLRDPQVARRPA
jgi:CarD family transcriptional regulator